LVGVLSVAAPFWVPSASATPTPNSIYSYTLTGVSGTPVPNAAAANTAVALKLQGTWAPSEFGVHFAGNRSNAMSVGFAKPSSGNTLYVPAAYALGATVEFRYEPPVSGGSCFSDSKNITQIGRYGGGLSQLKIQLSSCTGNKLSVFPECRMAGANSTTSDVPKRGTQALIAGETYVVRCYKGPDPASGSATLTLVTTHIDSVNGNTSTVNNFLITRPGLMSSTAYLSVANKYALPGQSNNTDNFNGDVAKVAYCKATTLAAMTTCLTTEVPAS